MKYIILLLLAFQMNHGSSFLSKQDKEQIDKIISTIPDSLRSKFDSTFNQWVNNWKTAPGTKMSSFTKTACELKEYDTLYHMGEDIIPLIVDKLCDYDNNFIGLQLYDRLQKDKAQKVYVFTSEQDKAQKTVLLWLKYHK